MKVLDTTQETATAWSPYKVETKQFLQDANNEVFEALIKSIAGQGYSSSVPYIIEGCVVSGGGPYSITAGKLFYGGVFYNVSSGSGLTGPIEFVTESTPDPTADTTKFSDGTDHNIHLDVHYKPVSSGGGGDFDTTDFVSIYGAGKVTQDIKTATYNTSSTTYVDLTSMTYTTPNDGITRRILIIANNSFDFSSSPGNGAFLQIWNGSSELAVSSNYLSIVAVNVDTTFLQLSCSYVGLIPPNTTIKLRVKIVNSASCNFLNNSLSIVEL